jgi:hypothetical protein
MLKLWVSILINTIILSVDIEVDEIDLIIDLLPKNFSIHNVSLSGIMN